MVFMMKNLFLLVLVFLLAGCAASTSWRAESYQKPLQATARRLATQIKAGKLTKTQAADRLNRERLALVGHQPVDDRVFGFYRRLTVQRDHGVITSAQARFQMQRELLAVRKRYQRHGALLRQSPAFTNFMMSLYGLPPL